MSQSRIQVGDLVMVVRGHECMMRELGGVPFIVTGFEATWGGGWRCNRCGLRGAGPNEDAAVGHPAARVPLSWLKRIDPLTEPTDIPTTEGIEV